jgi:hypothetical protein
MPVIRNRATNWVASRPRESLAQQISAELRGEKTQEPRPVIFEIPIQQNDTIHVIAVWDAWSDVSPVVRSEIIIEAYDNWDQETNPEDPASPRITTAIGVTPLEAIEMTLLPYRLRPTFPPGPIVGKDQIDRAMLEEGGIPYGGEVILGFPTRKMRDEALERLTRTAPQGNWFEDEER